MLSFIELLLLDVSYFNLYIERFWLLCWRYNISRLHTVLSKTLFLWYRNYTVEWIFISCRLLGRISLYAFRIESEKHKERISIPEFHSLVVLDSLACNKNTFLNWFFRVGSLRWAYIWARPTLARGNALVENWSSYLFDHAVCKRVIGVFIVLYFLFCPTFSPTTRDKKHSGSSYYWLQLLWRTVIKLNCSRRRQLKTERKSITSVIELRK